LGGKEKRNGKRVCGKHEILALYQGSREIGKGRENLSETEDC